MSKAKLIPITPVTASTIVSLTIAANKAEDKLTGATVQWVRFELDKLAASGVARDKSGGQVARAKILKLLVDACIERGSKSVADGGLGQAGGKLSEMKPVEVLEKVMPKKVTTWGQYLSGVARAYTYNLQWDTQTHHTKNKPVSADSATSAKALDDATVKVSADRKARTVTFSAGTKAAINADDVQSIIAAITADPGRMALALAWIKSHGWTTE